MPRASSSAASHAPAWPPTTATTSAGRPRWRAARTALRALPPGTAASISGRWIRPGCTASTAAILSIAGFSETPTSRPIRVRSAHGCQAAMAASISARVAWDAVPPTARVDMAPLIAAIRSADRCPNWLEPRGEEPGIEGISGARRVDGIDRVGAHAIEHAVRRRDECPVAPALDDHERSPPDCPPHPCHARRPRPPRRRCPRSRSPQPRWGTRCPAPESSAAGPNPSRPAGIPVGIDRRRQARVTGAARSPRRPDAARIAGTSSRCAGGGPAEQEAGTSSAVIAPIVPGAVRIARSRPFERITLAPVGVSTVDADGPHVHAAVAHRVEHEPPEHVVADDADDRNAEPEPGGGAGHDHRAAPDRRVDLADDAFDLSEDRSRIRIGDDDVGLTSPTTRSRTLARSAGDLGMSGVSIRRTNRPRAPRVGGPPPSSVATGRPPRSTSSPGAQPGRPLAREPCRSVVGGMTAAGAHTDRPTSTPLAPGCRPSPPGTRTSGRRPRPTAGPTAGVMRHRARHRPRSTGSGPSRYGRMGTPP